MPWNPSNATNFGFTLQRGVHHKRFHKISEPKFVFYRKKLKTDSRYIRIWKFSKSTKLFKKLWNSVKLVNIPDIVSKFSVNFWNPNVLAAWNTFMWTAFISNKFRSNGIRLLSRLVQWNLSIVDTQGTGQKVSPIERFSVSRGSNCLKSIERSWFWVFTTEENPLKRGFNVLQFFLIYSRNAWKVTILLIYKFWRLVVELSTKSKRRRISAKSCVEWTRLNWHSIANLSLRGPIIYAVNLNDKLTALLPLRLFVTCDDYGY